MSDLVLGDNRLLASVARSIPKEHLDLISIVELPQYTVVCEADNEVDDVYFPLSGMISMVVVMRDGKAVEVATVGREGAVGAMAGLGKYVSQVRAIVQIAGTAARISASAFRRMVAEHRALGVICTQYNEVLLDQARVTAACNALHAVEARFCRWLLQSSDRAGGDVIALTQEFLSEMLGVRRTSVTEVAQKMQKLGLIHYVRGRITIIDREGLKTVSCECYQTLRERAPA